MKVTLQVHIWYFSSPSIHLLLYLDSINTTRNKGIWNLWWWSCLLCDSVLFHEKNVVLILRSPVGNLVLDKKHNFFLPKLRPQF